MSPNRRRHRANGQGRTRSCVRAACITRAVAAAKARSRLWQGVTPDNQGFYGFHPNHKVYYEVMDYAKMLGDATKRNRIFFDKLTHGNKIQTYFSASY
jgi:hypothetical protein